MAPFSFLRTHTERQVKAPETDLRNETGLSQIFRGRELDRQVQLTLGVKEIDASAQSRELSSPHTLVVPRYLRPLLL